MTVDELLAAAAGASLAERVDAVGDGLEARWSRWCAPSCSGQPRALPIARFELLRRP